MSMSNGTAGKCGKNPVGIFIHNDAGGSSMNAYYLIHCKGNKILLTASQNTTKRISSCNDIMHFVVFKNTLPVRINKVN
ncbi:MAG: hypothetical protein SOY12_00215 [Schaedlerella sp.]|nr:hypothetical protein [Schaedlerella sp.]